MSHFCKNRSGRTGWTEGLFLREEKRSVYHQVSAKLQPSAAAKDNPGKEPFPQPWGTLNVPGVQDNSGFSMEQQFQGTRSLTLGKLAQLALLGNAFLPEGSNIGKLPLSRLRLNPPSQA